MRTPRAGAGAPRRRDRRIDRTRLLLRQALISLMEERGWDEVDVREICDRANVGRSTFYLHFRNKAELLANGFDDLRDELGRRAAASPTRDLPFLTGLIDHVVENRRLFKSIVGRRGSHAVQVRFQALVTQLVADDLRSRGQKGWQREADVHLIAGGLVEALGWWIDKRNGPDAEEFERYLRRCVRSLAQ